MKRLIVGISAAVLTVALSAPVWAQAPGSSPAMPGQKTGGPARATGAPGASAPMTPSPPMAGKKTGGPSRRSYYSASDREADQLNAQELSTLTGAPPPSPPMPGKSLKSTNN